MFYRVVKAPLPVLTKDLRQHTTWSSSSNQVFVNFLSLFFFNYFLKVLQIADLWFVVSFRATDYFYLSGW